MHTVRQDERIQVAAPLSALLNPPCNTFYVKYPLSAAVMQSLQYTYSILHLQPVFPCRPNLWRTDDFGDLHASQVITNCTFLPPHCHLPFACRSLTISQRRYVRTVSIPAGFPMPRKCYGANLSKSSNHSMTYIGSRSRF